MHLFCSLCCSLKSVFVEINVLLGDFCSTLIGHIYCISVIDTEILRSQIRERGDPRDKLTLTIILNFSSSLEQLAALTYLNGKKVQQVWIKFNEPFQVLVSDFLLSVTDEKTIWKSFLSFCHTRFVPCSCVSRSKCVQWTPV